MATHIPIMKTFRILSPWYAKRLRHSSITLTLNTSITLEVPMQGTHLLFPRCPPQRPLWPLMLTGRWAEQMVSVLLSYVRPILRVCHLVKPGLIVKFLNL